MDMRDMSDIGSLFGIGKDEQRISLEELGWCNIYQGFFQQSRVLVKDLCYRDI